MKLRAAAGKLRPRYVGPFEVLASVGKNAYKLQLPSSMAVHPVFNVSLLPVELDVEGDVYYEVEALLTHDGGYRRQKYLVRWKGYDESEDTWITEEELKQGAKEILL